MAFPKGVPRPANAGRKPRTPNKVTGTLREIAQKYTVEALQTLVSIMNDTEEAAPARVSAANAILDRGYGKPSQIISGDKDNPIVSHVALDMTGISDASLRELAKVTLASDG